MWARAKVVEQRLPAGGDPVDGALVGIRECLGTHGASAVVRQDRPTETRPEHPRWG
jgi:hypothetical protein